MAVDTKPGDGEARQLRLYWTKGPGLVKWANTAHPYTNLVQALRKAGVPETLVHELAASYFKDVFGIYPGQRPNGGRKS